MLARIDPHLGDEAVSQCAGVYPVAGIRGEGDGIGLQANDAEYAEGDEQDGDHRFEQRHAACPLPAMPEILRVMVTPNLAGARVAGRNLRVAQADAAPSRDDEAELAAACRRKCR